MARLVPLEPTQCEPSIYTSRVRRHTQQVFEELAARFAIYYAWGIGSSGHHAEGRALDLMAYSQGSGIDRPGSIRDGWNRKVSDYVWANRARLGVDYVIYDRLIQSNNPSGYAYGGWRTYRGESHANHVHISFEDNATDYQPPEEEMPSAKEVVDELLARQIPLTEGEQKRYPGYPDSISVRSLLVHAGAGQWLETATSEAPTKPAPVRHYTVQAGDTLGGIATEHRVTVEALAERNSISDPDRIFPGQVLVIPAEDS